MKKLAFLAACGAMLAQPAVAQNATTVPVGVMTISFPATTFQQSTTFAVPLRSTPAFVGGAAAFSANSLTVTGANWTPNQFSGNVPYYVQIQTGLQAGRVMKVLSNTANSVTLDTFDASQQNTGLDTTGFSVAQGDSFALYSGHTLGSLFGSTAESVVLVGDTSATRADTVGIWNPGTVRTDTFYFNTTVGTWVRFGAPTTQNENSRFLPVSESVVITRRPGRDLAELQILGEVPRVPSLVKHPGGTQVRFSSSMTPADVTFSQLVLGPNWKKNDSVTSADTIAIYNPAILRWETYFQRLTDGQWRRFGSNADQSAFVVTPGQTLRIVRRDQVSGSSSFTQIGLGYNLQ